MRKAVAIRPVAFADLGFVSDVLEPAGYTIEIVDAPDSEPGALRKDAPDLLLVPGGPISANDDELFPFPLATRGIAVPALRADSAAHARVLADGGSHMLREWLSGASDLD